jgi:hypothetical protein
MQPESATIDSCKKGSGEHRCGAKQDRPKNFFIAKCRDSESVQRIQIVSTSSGDFSEELIDQNVIFENRCYAAASCNIAIRRRSFWRILRFAAQIICRVDCDRASHALASSRKHFLKRDAVFFDVLVYSECGAFDSRVHAAIKPSH